MTRLAYRSVPRAALVAVFLLSFVARPATAQEDAADADRRRRPARDDGAGKRHACEARSRRSEMTEHFAILTSRAESHKVLMRMHYRARSAQVALGPSEGSLKLRASGAHALLER